VEIDEGADTVDPEKLRGYVETECTADRQTGRMVSKRSGLAPPKGVEVLGDSSR
jgi:hypothetical protein